MTDKYQVLAFEKKKICNQWDVANSNFKSLFTPTVEINGGKNEEALSHVGKIGGKNGMAPKEIYRTLQRG